MHIYADGPAGTGTLVGDVLASVYRADLSISDKAHGFDFETPQSLKDGKTHGIYVYAIDSNGGQNVLLGGSPLNIQCVNIPAVMAIIQNIILGQGVDAPAVSTNAASSVTTTSAVLNATVNPNGASTQVVFEYGTTTNYGNQIAATQSPLSGTGDQAASVTLNGLLSNTTYHYRVNATNSGGTSLGEDKEFKTVAETPPCPNCSGANPVVKDTVFYAGTDCECVGTESLTIGPNVTVQKNAKATFKSPNIKVKATVKSEQGSQVKMGR